MATAIAHPNIAFIKYWGNRDQALRLPANGSISMNLAALHTETSVVFDPALTQDTLLLNDSAARPEQLQRVSAFLDVVRSQAGIGTRAAVTSANNFPSGAGIASSSSAFAALAVAAAAAAGLHLDERALSSLARRGSGSASRSIPAGFVEWHAADTHEASYAETIAAPEYWDLVDCIAVVSEEHKAVGSSDGHRLAGSSPFQATRVAGAPERLDVCRQTILNRDFAAFAQVVEFDCHLMHAVMMTSTPPLHYWLPGSIAVMEAVRAWRADGLPVCYTLDAGPNVHVLAPAEHAADLSGRLAAVPGVLRVLGSGVGGAARLLDS